MPVKTLCFQNLRQEESRKSVLHALIERIQAYPDRKMEVKFRIGDKTLPPRVDIAHRVNRPRAGRFQLHSHLVVRLMSISVSLIFRVSV